MKKVLALGMVAVALAIAAAGAAAGTNPNTLTLAVFGDSPYLDRGYSRCCRTPNSTRRRRSSTRSTPTPACRRSCTSAISIPAASHAPMPYDQSIFTLWTAFQKPLIYTPGDNEWSDCTKANEEPGSDNDNVTTHPDLPLENLALIRNIFFANPGLDAGAAPMQVISQKDAYDPSHPTDAQYVENVMWEQSKTVFVTINVPGGSNNDIDPWYAKTHPSPWNPHQQAEMDQRTAADVRWLNAAFALAEADNAHSVVHYRPG